MSSSTLLSTTSATSQFSPARRAASSNAFGLLPVLAFTDALALLVISCACSASWQGAAWSPLALWLSLLSVFALTAWRLLLPSTSRLERCGVLILAAFTFYSVHLLQSPLHFGYYDEFLHWRTAIDILRNGRLFTLNPILPISAGYPGLEMLTTALVNVGSMSVFQASIIVIASARMILVATLYLFFERIGRSAQVGGIAALLYMANSNFVFFSTEFSYESLALPLAIVVLYVVLLQQSGTRIRPLAFLIMVSLLILAVAVSHHLTAYVLVGILGLWSTIAFLQRRTQRGWSTLAMTTFLALVIVLGWTLYAGTSVSSYLIPVVGGGITQLRQLIANDDTGRQLFSSSTGQVSPLWERVVGVASTLFILLMLPFGIWTIIRSPFRAIRSRQPIRVLGQGALHTWSLYRNNPLAIALSVIVLAHPVMLAFRFTSSGWEMANRSSEFVFLGVAFIMTAGSLYLQYLPHIGSLWKIGFLVWASVIFVGGAISGWPPWARLPGSYLVSADVRSIEPQGIAAATWAGDHLTAGARMATDRINTVLMATYGQQPTITHLEDGIYLNSVFFAPQVSKSDQQLIELAKVRYFTVDERLSTALPMVGVYFEAGEPGSTNLTSPPSLSALQKFNQMPNVSRIFDGGAIKIYDVSRIGTP